MANHKSAQKRSRQTLRKTKVNKIIFSQIKTSFNDTNNKINEKNIEQASDSIRLYNIALSKAVKRGIIKQRSASRKLSSLSDKLKKII
tara:strand:- start:1404 stop:1667 length:264 start_codon:yes stop_codon:yes gene_type:complete